jgi:hypothetical protein
MCAAQWIRPYAITKKHRTLVNGNEVIPEYKQPNLIWEIWALLGWLMMKRTTFAYRDDLQSNKPEDVRPYWTDDALDAMDRAFCARMLDAVDAGLERCSKRVSTMPGTKFPIANYRRPD